MALPEFYGVLMAPVRARLRPRRWGLAASVAASVLVLLATTASLMLLAWLALGRPVVPRRIENTTQFFDGIKILLAVVAGLAAAVGLTVSYRKQRGEEEASFTSRYASAAEQLGHDRAAVRLAGVYAMAKLADDWESQRRTCIYVLCAYIRMPYEPSTAPEGEHQVRFTIISIIAEHLRPASPISWQGYDFDFTGATFDAGSFVEARFTGGRFLFNRAVFRGPVAFLSTEINGASLSFAGARFEGGAVLFNHTHVVAGEVRFDRMSLGAGGGISFRDATVDGGVIDFRYASFCGGKLNFSGATITQGSVSLRGATLREGVLNFRGVRIRGGLLDFEAANFRGSGVWFDEADFQAGRVSYVAAKFLQSHVSFDQATFRGGRVSFDGAEFAGGTVGLKAVADWSVPAERLPTATSRYLTLPTSEH